jgi:hypothetical protein
MSNKKTAHTEAELIEIFKKDNIDTKYNEKFITYYQSCFNELYEDHKDWNDDDWRDGDSVQASALWCTNYFIKRYLELMAKGHGEEWAHELAHTAEEGERAVFFVYSDLSAINPELAKKELLIHAKSFGYDEYFEKHFIFLFEEVADPVGRIESAKNYSRIYKEQLSKGKSEIYAHHYADLISYGDYNEIYCEEYAFAFDKAISENKNENYAIVYADKYGSALVNIKGRYGISDDEEMIDFAIQKVNAYMKAWEYGTENKLVDFNRFAEIYENVYLNTFYSESKDFNKSESEIEKQVLEEVLKRFNKNER